MITDKFLKVTRIAGGASPLVSPEFSFENYRTVAFLFENTEWGKLAVKIKGQRLDGTSELVPFLFQKIGSRDFEEAGTDGKVITGGGGFVALVSGDKLGCGDIDRVQFHLISDGNIGTVYALQTDPRYSE